MFHCCIARVVQLFLLPCILLGLVPRVTQAAAAWNLQCFCQIVSFSRWIQNVALKWAWQIADNAFGSSCTQRVQQRQRASCATVSRFVLHWGLGDQRNLFACVFNTSGGPWDLQSPGLEDCNLGSDKLPVDFELVQYLLLQLTANNANKPLGSDGFHTSALKKAASVIVRLLSFI